MKYITLSLTSVLLLLLFQVNAQESTKTKQTQSINSPSKIDTLKERLPLYVVKGAGKSVQFNASVSRDISAKKTSPFDSMPQGYIREINVLKDSAAIKAYPLRGKYGVIIITIADEHMPEIVDSLKAKGYVDQP